MLRGYSVSACIRDIIEGKVALSDVAEIVGMTRARTVEEWDRVAASYGRSYWEANPTAGRAVLWTLLAADKIRQPRVEDPDHAHRQEEIWEELEETDGEQP